MRVQSWTTLIGASLLLAAHALAAGAITGEGTAHTRLTALLAVPFAVSALTAFIASFSASAHLRATTATAALLSTLPPALILLGYFGFGLIYIPGMVILLIALFINAATLHYASRVLTSLAIGLFSALMFLLSYWPIFRAGDLCDHLDRVGTWTCVPAISPQGVAIGFAIIGAAALLPWFTMVVLRYPRSGTADDSASIPPQVPRNKSLLPTTSSIQPVKSPMAAIRACGTMQI